MTEMIAQYGLQQGGYGLSARKITFLPQAGLCDANPSVTVTQ